MGMLASLLPGIRDLRAPLAAGYIWLLLAWLIVQPRIEASEETEPVQSISRLAHTLSPAGVAIAVSFIAYLIGSLLSAIHELIGNRITEGSLYSISLSREKPWWSPPRKQIHFLKKLVDRYRSWQFRRRGRPPRTRYITIEKEIQFGKNRVYATARVHTQSLPFVHVVDGFSKDMTRALAVDGRQAQVYWQALGLELFDSEFLDDQQILRQLLAARAYEERELIADGLLDEGSDLYGVVDRLRGEVLLRDATTLPILAVILYLAWTHSPLWAICLSIVAGLAFQRRKLEQQRIARIVAAISWKPTRVPTLMRIQRMVLPAGVSDTVRTDSKPKELDDTAPSEPSSGATNGSDDHSVSSATSARDATVEER